MYSLRNTPTIDTSTGVVKCVWCNNRNLAVADATFAWNDADDRTHYANGRPVCKDRAACLATDDARWERLLAR